MLKRYIKRKKRKEYEYFMKRVGSSWKHISRKEFMELSDTRSAPKLSRRELRQMNRSLPSGVHSDAFSKLLISAGYSLRGKAMHISRLNFFTIAAAKVRFRLLSQEYQQLVGSAERLLSLSLEAWKLHKKLNLTKKANSFPECFEAILSKLTESSE